ncbi:unknown [Salmonella phage FelixO1]|uniref:Uncharacterized protein n=1 Tax=Salmonella phage Felix O1 (isolate Felix O1-VT1) TaxID=1283336 RepID=Q6KGH2_BPFO1|nr:unknown [Salmonella phage FelixO1]
MIVLGALCTLSVTVCPDCMFCVVTCIGLSNSMFSVADKVKKASTLSLKWK